MALLRAEPPDPGPGTAMLPDFSLEKVTGQTDDDSGGGGGDNGGERANLLRAYCVPSTVLSI